MIEVNGVVEAKRKDGKAIKVAGVWYSAYTASTLSLINEGETVTFNYAPSPDGRFNNIKGKVVGVLVSPPTGAFVPPLKDAPKNPHYQFPISPTDSQRSILRQNALTNARELVTWMHGFDDDTKRKKSMEYVDVIIAVARKFEEYTSGDSDMEIAKRKLAEMEAE